MASDHERELQTAETGKPNWEAKAVASLPRLIDPAEVARAINLIVSDDAGLMTGAVVNFDQTVWGATAGAMPVPKSRCGSDKDMSRNLQFRLLRL